MNRVIKVTFYIPLFVANKAIDVVFGKLTKDELAGLEAHIERERRMKEREKWKQTQKQDSNN